MTIGNDGIRDEFLEAAVDMLRRSSEGGVMRLQGESMRPTFRPGQSIAIEFAPTDLSRGDVLVFRQGDHLLVHRLLGLARSAGRQEPRFRTRGDGTPALDPVVESDRIVGRVTAVESGGRWRSTRSRGARVYGCCLGWHHLCWTALGLLAGKADRGLTKLGVRALFRPAVGYLDVRLLGVAHAVAFRAMHPRISPPADARE